MPRASSPPRRRGLLVVAGLAAAAALAAVAAASLPAEASRPGPAPDVAADSLTAAKCAWADRDYLRAERLLRERLAGRADDPAARTLLGRVLLELGRVDAAQALFANLVKARPDDPEALRGLAAASQAQGRTDLALLYWHRAADLRKDDAGLWKELSAAQRAAGDGPGALASAQQAMTADPERQDLRDWVADLAQNDARPRIPGRPADLPGFLDARPRSGILAPPDPRRQLVSPVTVPTPPGRHP